MMESTLVTDEVRRALSQDPELGAGNFLKWALGVSPNPETPLLFLERPFLTPSGEVTQLSLSLLARLADTYAAWYQGKGIASQDLVSIFLDDGIEYLIHYLGLTKIGAIPVLINGNMAPHIALAYAAKVGSSGLVVDDTHDRLLTSSTSVPASLGNQTFRFIASGDDRPRSFARPKKEYHHVAGDPIMIAHSSGTTGIPKAVLLEHDKFFYGIRYRLSLPRVAGGERILSSLPHSHNCAISYIILALLSGTPVFIASDHRGEAVLRMIESFKPTMVVSFPQTYVEMTEEDMDAYDLSSVELWFNGGDAAHEAHIRKLISYGTRKEDGKYSHGSVFIDGMGSSEMGFSLFRHVHTPNTNHYGRCVGKPLPWVDAAVLAENGQKLPPLQIGRLGVRAPSVTSGYWNDSKLTYKSRLAGYFLTGDLAYRDAEGRFYHVDRVPDAITLSRGTIYTLQTEEFLLRSFPEIADCSVVQTPSGTGSDYRVTALIRIHKKYDPESTRTPALTKDRINMTLASGGLPVVDEVQFVRAGQIPLGTTGKVLKRVLRDVGRAQVH